MAESLGATRAARLEKPVAAVLPLNTPATSFRGAWGEFGVSSVAER
ncbi:hypothetical protein ACFWG5_14670 [Streptomyces hydrogenans]